MIQIVAMVIAAAIPLLSFYLIYRLDLYKTGDFKWVLASGFAGIIAFYIASVINRTFILQGWLSRENVIRYSAPLVEEILKGLLLLFMVRRPSFTYFVSGAIYGFAAGIGFAIFENFQYIQASQGAGLALAINRVLSTNLIHASTTGILGIALGLARFQRGWRFGLYGMLGLLLAVLMHIGYNNLVTRVVSLLLVYAVASGLIGAGLITFAIKQGLKEARTWIEEKLGQADRVTRGEAAVVQHLENVDDILKPLAEIFGDKKASQIQHFLTIQARLGIYRKSLEKLSDERMKKGVEAKMAELRKEMDDARREVGSYAMLYLRHTFPEDASPLWGRLEAAIQEKAAARPVSGGTNVWANLKARQEERNSPSSQSQSEK